MTNFSTKTSVLILAMNLLFAFTFWGQNNKEENNNKGGFLYAVQAQSMEIVQPYFDAPIPQLKEDGKTYVVKNNLRRRKFANRDNALPKGGDPLVSRNKSTHPNKAPIINFEGLAQGESGGAMPPDPSGAAGPNHYVQMVNTVYRVFDKQGNPITNIATLGSLLGGGNDGDPIVMYDKFADRWFLSQFSQQNKLIVAISQTPDPTGSYYLYTFQLQSFPDYPKYSVWSDGYYVTANKSGDNTFVLERDKMIAGDPTAQIQAFNLPSLSTSGFFSVLPAMASSSLPPAGTPNYLFYFQDDAWAGGTDHLKVWELSVNWATPTSSTISPPQSITVTPFDSEFNQAWDDITQPGTSNKLDAVPGALMYMAHFRSFATYDAVVLNHTVDVNGANQAGIRWYELRKNTGSSNWTLYQEGTFSPDNENRWMGSIAMDNQGNIGLAYSVSGNTTYPSLKYTGRYASDPLGQMTLAEEVIVSGTEAQQNGVRFGDYAQMTIDPTDDATFWFTGEYIAGGEWKTRITSFKIASSDTNDVGISAVTAPVDGALTNAETITVTVKNYGLSDQSNFPVSYQINGGTVVTETYSGTLTAGASAPYNFTATADLSTQGVYNIKAFTGLSNDQNNINDTTNYTVNHLFSADVGVTSILAPVSQSSMSSNENITVKIKNFGAQAQSNIPVSYQINNNPVVSETYSGTIAPGATFDYTFATTGDFSALATYQLKAYTTLSGDGDLTNDTTATTVEHQMCQPSADCAWGDGITLFKLKTINNPSSCSTDGYGDYTQMIATLEQGVTHPLTIQSGYTDQYATVWIDFNDNFNFEPSERVLTNVTFGTALFDTSITIPANANMGEHLLRIQTNYQANTGDNGCNPPSSGYGETEDYKVNIIAFTGVEEELSETDVKIINIDKNRYKITSDNSSETYSIQLINTLGQTILTGGFNGSDSYIVDLTNVSKGHYLLKVSNPQTSKIEKLTVN